MASNYQVLPSIFGGGPPIGPYLIPPSFPATAANPLTIAVPNVRGSAGTGVGCTIAPAGANTDFGLSWTTVSGQPIALVSVQPGHVYSDAPADRAALLASFGAFLLQLEALELDGSTGCLAPGGADVVARVVAGSLPLRIDEVLAYECGAPPGANHVDLAPGMRLRIQPAGYSLVAPSSPWNSFAGPGAVTCLVARSSSQDVCFDAFLAGTQTGIQLGTPAWIATVADLVSLGARRHFRLLIPHTTPAPSQTGAAPAFGETPALVGADTWTDLDAATAAYFASGGTVTATSGRPVISAAFTGRPVVVPELPVSFFGQWTYLPVGGTVQHLLDGCNPLLRSQLPRAVLLTRAALAGITDPKSPSVGVFGPTQVAFTPTTTYVSQPEGGALSQWDLPLLAGDALSGWTG